MRDRSLSVRLVAKDGTIVGPDELELVSGPGATRTDVEQPVGG
jgi:hypothetical protein